MSGWQIEGTVEPLAKSASSTNLFDRLKSSAAVRSNQSGLYQWMMRNFDAFAAMRAESAPGWDVVAAELNAEGFSKPGGAQIDAAYARQTWWKVRKARQGRPTPAAPAASSVLPVTPDLPAPRSRPPVAAPIADDDDDGFVLTAGDGTPISQKD